MAKKFQYFVEGECEKRFIDLIKNPKYSYISPGKVEVLNVVNEYISKNRLFQLSKDTEIVLLYDTDVAKTNCLEENVARLKKYGFNKIYHIHSVKDFEDEITYACNLKSINKFYEGIHTKNEFKNRFLRDNDAGIINKMEKNNYDNDKMWARNGDGVFSKYDTKNGRKLIKK